MPEIEAKTLFNRDELEKAIAEYWCSSGREEMAKFLTQNAVAVERGWKPADMREAIREYLRTRTDRQLCHVADETRPRWSAVPEPLWGSEEEEPAPRLVSPANWDWDDDRPPVPPASQSSPGPAAMFSLDLDVGRIRVVRNFRKHFDPADMADLVASVRTYGVLQPLIVRPADEDGCWELIAGERRLRAAREVGLVTVPGRVLNISRREADELCLLENVQRQDLSPLEEAEGYRLLIWEHGYTQESLAGRFGKSTGHISERLGLLDLPDVVRQAVDRRELAMRSALALRPYLTPGRPPSEEVERVAAEMVECRPPAAEAAEWVRRRLDQGRPKVQQTELPAIGTGEPPPASAPNPAPPPPTKQPTALQASAPAPQPPTPSPPAPPTPAPQVSAPEPTPAPAEQPPPPAPFASALDTQIVRDAEPPSSLHELGRSHWPPALQGYESAFDCEGLIPLQAVLAHWQVRLAIGPGLPRGCGRVEIHIPEQHVWIRGPESAIVKPADQYRPEELATVLDGSRLTVQCAHGRVDGTYNEDPVYYRAAVYVGRGGSHKLLRQQIVIRDGDRHLVVIGTDTITILHDRVKDLEAMLSGLSLLPVEEVMS